MKNLLFTFLAIAALNLNAQNYIIDKTKSQVNWKAFKIGGSHEGTIDIKSCQLKLTNNELTSATIVLDMTSIKITDIESESSNKKLMDVFHSPSFFDIQNHPNASFQFQSGQKSTIVGMLTIKDITKSSSFPIEYQLQNQPLSIKGKIIIDRQNYNISYDGGIFSALGDKVIKDEFEISFELVLIER